MIITVKASTEKGVSLFLMPKSERSNELVQKFKIYVGEDGKSVKTVESYIGDTSAFVDFLESKGVEFTGEMKRFYITSYRNYLIKISINWLLSIRSLIVFISSIGIW